MDGAQSRSIEVLNAHGRHNAHPHPPRIRVPLSFIIMAAGALTTRIAVFALGVILFTLAFVLLFLTEARRALDRRQ